MLELAGPPAAIVYAERQQGASAAEAGNAAEAGAEATRQRRTGCWRRSTRRASPPRSSTPSRPRTTVSPSGRGGRGRRAGRAAGREGRARDSAGRAREPLERRLIGGPGVESFGETGDGMRSPSSTPASTTAHGVRRPGDRGRSRPCDSSAANPADPDLDPAGFTVMDGATQIYPNAKVVGGLDFVGDAYNGGQHAAAGPEPDGLQRAREPRLRHCRGQRRQRRRHCLHRPVRHADGHVRMRDRPRRRSRGEIYAYRVFGCAGSTAVTARRSTGRPTRTGDGNPADHLDVINMSLGAAYGTPTTLGCCEPQRR